MSRPLNRKSRFNLKRVVWRWHFLAALFVSPVLLVVSLSGAIYVFKPELAPLLHPDILSVERGSRNAPLDQQIAAVSRHVGPSWTPVVIDVDLTISNYPNGVVVENEAYEARTIFTNPNSGKVLGEIESPNFFGVVLAIHESLLTGTVGRFFVEVATCWGIFLAVTGFYLWWPRSFRALKGVWVPRLRGKFYVILRDLHTLPGIWLWPILVIILMSALLFTVVWGTAYHAVAFMTNAYAVRFEPPESLPIAGANRVSLDAVWNRASRLADLRRTSIHLPRHERDSFRVETGGDLGASVSTVMVFDQYSGQLLLHKSLGELPWMAQVTSWAYPFHVGSVLGFPTKVLWLVASLIFGLLPITGLMMWLIRRRPGSLGFPNRYDAAMPSWLVVVLILFGIVLPTAGLTLLVAAICETAITRRRKRRLG